jgi:hypothetical protein
VIVAVIVVALLAIGLVTWSILHRRRAAEQRSHQMPIPIVAFPGITSPPEVARPAIRRPGQRPPPSAAPVYVPPPRDGSRRVEFSVPPAPPEHRFASPEDGAASSELGAPAPRRAATTVADDVGDPYEGESLRFHRPADPTLQFLPGRLEIIAGADQGHEIRFVKSSGSTRPEITFGRSEGPPYRHVQLRQQTVSRNHARMTLDGSAWSLTNLSTTNPVIVNGQELAGDGGTVMLSDGDRIEMGEVAFRFRER